MAVPGMINGGLYVRTITKLPCHEMNKCKTITLVYGLETELFLHLLILTRNIMD
jgi:hypothetical protein